jgi:site-specific recombinase XerD
MAGSPDSHPVRSLDSRRNPRASLDSSAPDRFSGADSLAVGLGTAVDLFLAAKAAEGSSPRTVEWYRYVLGRAVRRLGPGRPIDGVGAPELRAWLLELRETLSPESVAGFVRGLKAFGNWCAAEELGTAPGLRALRRPRVPRRLIAPFTDAELQRLLALAEPRERAIILLLLDTGLRLAEVTPLRVGDLRPDGTVRVMGKGSKERIVPIGVTARRAVLRYVAGRGAARPGDALFVGVRGAPIQRRVLQIAIADLGRRAGVGTRCSPHTFRHTFARSFLVNGGDVFSLQQILGHTTLDMVRRYVSLTEADLVARHRVASPADRLARGRSA